MDASSATENAVQSEGEGLCVDDKTPEVMDPIVDLDEVMYRQVSLGWKVGKRDQETADAFVADLRSRLTVMPAKDPGHEVEPPTAVGWVRRHASAIGLIGGGAIAVAGGGISAALWITGQIAELHRDINSNATDIRKEIADLRTAVSADAARTSEKLEGINTRLTRLENRMDAKFGADTDGDAGAPSDAGATWSAAHVARRDKLCADQCN